MPSSPIGVLCDKKQKIFAFMHVHIPVLVFITTGDDHKIRMLSHLIFNTLENCNREGLGT